MENKAVLYGVIGLLAGILLAIIFARTAVNGNNVSMIRMMGMNLRSESMMNNDKAQGIANIPIITPTIILVFIIKSLFISLYIIY